ncbi:hypothetical protein B566_EDAN008686 [Ephemera danica]|nr:hypothetical protein B566_EDAN008686 [Ephemera danica]
MKGWFDAFRTEGGPTLYSHSNRTPVTGDVETVTLAAVFCTIFIAFLVIFPGVRKENFRYPTIDVWYNNLNWCGCYYGTGRQQVHSQQRRDAISWESQQGDTTSRNPAKTSCNNIVEENRRKRFSTFMSVTLSLFVGSVILGPPCLRPCSMTAKFSSRRSSSRHSHDVLAPGDGRCPDPHYNDAGYRAALAPAALVYISARHYNALSQAGSGWHVACSNIVSSYRAFSREKISAQLGAYVGLGHVNVTLTAPQHHNATHLDAEDIDFNERFHWSGPGEMQERYRAALERGLPFPILTVAEVLNLDQEGFSWGRQYREAGYYTGITLW